MVDGHYRIKSQPPIVVPLRDIGRDHGMSADEIEHGIREQFREYRSTLQDDRRHLLERFEIIDIARKVVGVGSVGTRGFIALLQGRDEQDPLFLQVKEATGRCWRITCRRAGTTTRGAGRAGPAGDAGGQRHLPGLDEGRQDDRYFYWRQLRDMKGPRWSRGCRRSCWASTARCAAGRWPVRTPAPGTRWRLPSTWARTTASTQAITDFSERYADQNEKDYQEFVPRPSPPGGWKHLRVSEFSGIRW